MSASPRFGEKPCVTKKSRVRVKRFASRSPTTAWRSSSEEQILTGCQGRRPVLRIGVGRPGKSSRDDVQFTRGWSRCGAACAAPGADSVAGHAIVGATRLAWLDGYQELSPRERPPAPAVLVALDEGSLGPFGPMP